MAFGAIHPEAGRIDATLPDLGCGLSWDQVHRVRPRVALRCPECGHGVHAKVSSRKLQYFAHDPGRPADCAWLNESLEHHLLKLELATAIRAAGWHAELEVRAQDGTWRADVLASSHDGAQRMAWEAQLSPITDDDIQDRTARYGAEGIRVCWVSPAERVSWIGVVPSIQVLDPNDDRPWTVTDGVGAFDYPQGTWGTQSDLELAAVVRWALEGQIVVHPVLPRYRRIWLGDGTRRYARRDLIWTTSRHIDAEARHESMRQRQQAWKLQQEEKERQVEETRKQEAEARRLEEARLREVEAAAARLRFEEQQRQWAIKAEQARQQREAEERRRQEVARAAEQQRLQREREEYQAAQRWWVELSPAQERELRDAVADPVWKSEGTRVEFDSQGATADNAYGTAVYRRHRLHGIMRPSPASLHRLPDTVTVFVRNAREAQQLIDTGQVDAGRVVNFGLPDHEQMFLI